MSSNVEERGGCSAGVGARENREARVRKRGVGADWGDVSDSVRFLWKR